MEIQHVSFRLDHGEQVEAQAIGPGVGNGFAGAACYQPGPTEVLQ